MQTNKLKTAYREIQAVGITELPEIEEMRKLLQNKSFTKFAKDYKKSHAQFYRDFYQWLLLFWWDVVGEWEIKINESRFK